MVTRIGRRTGVVTLSLIAVAALMGAAPRPSSAQGLGSCVNPPPYVNTGALAKYPPAVLALVNTLPSVIQPQSLNVPGISVAVVLDQDVVFAAGFGCAQLPAQGQSGIPATPSTFYRIESVTKVFEATMLMQQRDRQVKGLLHFKITDRVSKRVPPVFYLLVKKTSSKTYSPTYLELASHTSGLPDQIPPGLKSVDQYWQFLEASASTRTPSGCTSTRIRASSPSGKPSPSSPTRRSRTIRITSSARSSIRSE